MITRLLAALAAVLGSLWPAPAPQPAVSPAASTVTVEAAQDHTAPPAGIVNPITEGWHAPNAPDVIAPTLQDVAEEWTQPPLDPDMINTAYCRTSDGWPFTTSERTARLLGYDCWWAGKLEGSR